MESSVQPGASGPPGQTFGLPVSPATMYLAVREGADPARCFPLDASIRRLGRSGQHADIVLRGDPRISRRHATIIRLPHPRGAYYIIVDEGSRNGVLVNDRRVEVHCLSPCDVIRLGSTVLEFLPEELLPAERDLVTLEPLSVDPDPERKAYRKPGEVY